MTGPSVSHTADLARGILQTLIDADGGVVPRRALVDLAVGLYGEERRPRTRPNRFPRPDQPDTFTDEVPIAEVKLKHMLLHLADAGLIRRVGPDDHSERTVVLLSYDGAVEALVRLRKVTGWRDAYKAIEGAKLWLTRRRAGLR